MAKDVKSTTAASEVDEDILDDPNITPLHDEDEQRRGNRQGNVMVGLLRQGYAIQIGADSNDPDAFIHGPAKVPLTKKLATAHLCKFDNVREIRLWLVERYGLTQYAPGPRRLSAAERLDQDVERASKINQLATSKTAQLNGDGEVGKLRNEVKELTATVSSLASIVSKLHTAQQDHVETLGGSVDVGASADDGPRRSGRKTNIKK
jgi:hypothetical protein